MFDLRVMRRRLFASLLLLPLPALATSLDEAVAQVRAQTDGRILSAETRQINGTLVHEIRVLTSQGRVRQIHIDAGDGASQPPPGQR